MSGRTRCIVADQSRDARAQEYRAACGRQAWREFMFVSVDHARRAVEQGTTTQPCPKCLAQLGGGR